MSRKQMLGKNVILHWVGVVLYVLSFNPIPGKALPQSEGQSRPGTSDKTKSEEAGGPDTPLPRLSMDSQSGSPGANVVLPLYLTPPPSVELRSLTVEIEWVSQNVRFVRLERGVAAESIGANITGKVTRAARDAKSIEHSTLQIDAAVAEQNPPQGFPEGLLAYLIFAISPEAQPFTIELRPKLIAADTVGSSGRKFTQAEVQDGKIIVDLPGLPAYVTCFFFTH